MKLIKEFSLTVLAAVAAMAFVGATSASANTATQLCKVHTSLNCEAGDGTSSVHMALATGSIMRILGLMTILCLGVLLEATPLGLNTPQSIHVSTLSFTGCGTDAGHSSCTLTTNELPLGNLLKTGLDEGVLQVENGQLRLQCPAFGGLGSPTDCLYDLEGSEFSVGAQHLTMQGTPIWELGGKFSCLQEEVLDGLLETLDDTYVLG